MMDRKARGWILLIGAVLAAWFTWKSNLALALYIVAIVQLVSAWHHLSAKK
jgi:hypothetical protein